jgi:signal transduction histidine kinase
MARIPPRRSPGISPSSLNALRAGAIVFFVTLGVLLLMYYRAKLIVRNEVGDYLVSVASIAASMVEGDLHESFTSPDQESSAAYLSAVEPLARILSSSDDLRFVYTMRRIDSGYYFVLDGTPYGDADSDGVEDHSPIMQRYPDEDVTPQLRQAFDSGSALSDIRTQADAWGVYLSGYAPIRNSEGELVGIAGVDMSEDKLKHHISQLAIGFHIGLAVSIILSLLSAWLVGFFRRSSRRAGEDLHRAAEVLDESVARYRSLFENSPAALWELDFTGVRNLIEERLSGVRTLDPAGLFKAQPGLVAECLAATGVLAMNKAARLLYEIGESRPAHILQVVFTDRSYELFEKLVLCVAGQSDSGMGEDERRTLTGRRISVLVNWIVAPGHEERHDRMYVSELDVTDLRMTEDARKLLEEQFLQAQKMESVGRLAGGVAHDINNMLTPVIGYTELAQDSLPDGLVAKVHLEQVHSSAMRIRDLVGQLLAFARKQSLLMESVSLPAELQAFTGVLNGILGSRIELEYSLDPSTPPIRADRVQIQQVILNLAVNARDAMKDGGILRIRSGREVISGYIDVGGEPLDPGVYAVLKVEDTGTGMSSETMSHLFEPFFTTKPPGEGTGLGLSTVYGIVRQHGGGIAVSSTPGEGTTFVILFPAFDQGGPTSNPTRPSREGDAVSGRL